LAFENIIKIKTMQPLNLEQLKKLPLSELIAIRTIIHERMPTKACRVYEDNCFAISDSIDRKMAIYSSDSQPFEFYKWLIDSGWTANEEDFTKQFIDGLVKLEGRFKKINAYCGKICIFKGANQPKTQNEAETLFKLFGLL